MKKYHISLSKNFLIISVLDILLLIGSIQLSYFLRFDFRFHPIFHANLMKALPLVLITKLCTFHLFDLYNGMWRYTGIRDLFNVIKASTVSSLVIFTGILLTTRFIGFPRSVFIIDWCLTIFLIAGSRLGVRFFFEVTGGTDRKTSLRSALKKINYKNVNNRKHLLIIGAGNCGEIINREIRNNRKLQYHIVGFLDDHPTKHGKKIHGAPVLGAIDQINLFIEKLRIDEILIAIPSAKGSQMRRIVGICKQTGLPFKTIPGYGELIDGHVSVRSIREVAYCDLLRREIVKLDEAGIAAYLKGKTIFVTGAGGSIGSELCRQICRFAPLRICLFERAESPLYHIELELREHFRNIEIIPILGDLLNENQVQKAFGQFDPKVVFHAAAYKHVPMLEIQPWKAVENNIQGTVNLLGISVAYEVERFVFVSTDKAVRPTNVMGASKRIAEMLIQCQPQKSDQLTKFSIVRFGNVLGSVGSVVPLFKKQIEKGGPITVTHPEITRYFMTIPEACQLILQAGALGNDQVNIYILDMGDPIKIVDMAKDLIRLSGLEPEKDIKIEYTGLRPGEKLYEELITKGEGIVRTSHEKIMALHGESCNLDLLNGKIMDLVQSATMQDKNKIKRLLQEIVLDYKPFEMRN